MTLTRREIMFIILMWRTEAGENSLSGGRSGKWRQEFRKHLQKGTREVGGVTEFRVEAQKEGIILHYPNDHLNKRMGEETTLHSINSSFVVSELLMMYKGARHRSPGQCTLCVSNYSQESADNLYTWRHIS